MIRVGIIGYGYWGPNLLRNFVDTPDCQVIAVSDLRPERLLLAQKRHPGIQATTNCRELIADTRIDAVVIATPVSSHFELAVQSLRAGKHVLVEKPLTTSAEQAAGLIEEADRRKRLLMVDHTFVYTGAVGRIRDLIADGTLGDVYYYDSVRVNLGLFRSDVSVIWDLAVHDLSIMDFVLPRRPVSIAATGLAHFTGQPENIAYLTMFFDGPLIAHVHVNWLAPVKVRRTLIGGSRKMIVYDDLEASEKLKVYDTGVTGGQDRDAAVYEMLVSYRSGDMWAPNVGVTEALQNETRHFIQCIQQDERPITDGEAGMRVVRLLGAAGESMANGGRPVTLTSAAWAG